MHLKMSSSSNLNGMISVFDGQSPDTTVKAHMDIVSVQSMLSISDDQSSDMAVIGMRCQRLSPVW